MLRAGIRRKDFIGTEVISKGVVSHKWIGAMTSGARPSPVERTT